LPCDACIGGTVPPGAAAPDIAAQLAEVGIVGATPEEIVTALNNLEQDTATHVAAEKITFSSAGPVAGPYHQSPIPPKRRDGAFGGRDLIFVHGLSLCHLKARLNPLSSDHAASGAKW